MFINIQQDIIADDDREQIYDLADVSPNSEDGICKHSIYSYKNDTLLVNNASFSYQIKKWFKLHWTGKTLASTLQMWVIGDVVSDIVVIWILVDRGEVWWALASIFILYLSLRFMLVFTMSVKEDFFGLVESKSRFGPILFRLWDFFRTSGRFSWKGQWVETSLRTIASLYIPGARTTCSIQQEIQENLILWLPRPSIIVIELFLIPIYILICSPFVLVGQVMKGIQGIWETTSVSFYTNTLDTQSLIFYSTIASLFETSMESIPQISLQSLIYWYCVDLIPSTIYFVSITFSILSIFKSLCVFIFARTKLENTLFRLSKNLTNEENFRLFGERNEEVTELDLRTFNATFKMRVLQNCPNVQRLNVSGSDISDHEIEQVVKHTSQLNHLDISSTYISDESLKAIAAYLKQLQYLDFSYTSTTDAGLAAIAEGCRYLNYINLSFTNVTDSGVSFILLHCRQLNDLILTWEKFTIHERKKYQTNYPNIVIRYVH